MCNQCAFLKVPPQRSEHVDVRVPGVVAVRAQRVRGHVAIYVYIYMYIYVYIYMYMCKCICILKTLRVTAVSTGDGVIFEQGGSQGIGRNHQDPPGSARFTRLGGSQRASCGFLGGPQGRLKYSGGGQQTLTPAPI